MTLDDLHEVKHLTLLMKWSAYFQVGMKLMKIDDNERFAGYM